VNEVNGGDNVFVRCVCVSSLLPKLRPVCARVCVCVCVCACFCVRSGKVNESSLKWEVNANSSKTVKATDFKFDKRVSRDNRT